MIRCFIFLLLPLSLISQPSKNNTKGSLIISVICKDGILMAADTRSSFAVDSLGYLIPYASVDGFKKITRLGNFHVGLTGYNSFKNQYLTTIIEEYNKLSTPENSMKNTYKNFRSYLKDTIGVSDSFLIKNQFIISGFENGIPSILSYDSGYKKNELLQTNFPNRLFSTNDFKPYFDTIVLMRL